MNIFCCLIGKTITPPILHNKVPYKPRPAGKPRLRPPPAWYQIYPLLACVIWFCYATISLVVSNFDITDLLYILFRLLTRKNVRSEAKNGKLSDSDLYCEVIVLRIFVYNKRGFAIFRYNGLLNEYSGSIPVINNNLVSLIILHKIC